MHLSNILLKLIVFLAFIYCCPGKSPQKLRMVYSTAKGSVISDAKGLGFGVTKTGEIGEPSELTSQYISSLTPVSSARSTPVSTPGTPGSPFGPYVGRGGPTRAVNRNSGDQVKASRQSVIEGAHPVYSLMGSPGSSGRSKKIVLPPPGAY